MFSLLSAFIKHFILLQIYFIFYQVNYAVYDTNTGGQILNSQSEKMMKKQRI